MAQDAAHGRHRTAGRHNPLTEIAGIIARAGDTGVKASAVLAASGGLVAAFALPATAAPAAPAALTLTTAHTIPKPERVLKAAPALVAPAEAAPVSVAKVGVIGVKAVAKPEPEPVVELVSAATAQPAVQQAASRSETRVAAPPATGGVIGVAMSLVGIPYVYGGSTPSGFDCSGFTSYVYAQLGKGLPRTAAAQQAAATPVSNPQPGDLVFFGFPAYHVGIYAGNGMMIDSPRTGFSTALRSIWDGGATYGRP